MTTTQPEPQATRLLADLLGLLALPSFDELSATDQLTLATYALAVGDATCDGGTADHIEDPEFEHPNINPDDAPYLLRAMAVPLGDWFNHPGNTRLAEQEWRRWRHAA
ncbi:hypothetical protein [Parafrankia discariae]|uniref:hypothetical protein n=1 Tax=Parafrankia discariae TaxID=365528 RepID=UPI00037CC5D5|nr:hypothetical protein [Parafrankia discariae]